MCARETAGVTVHNSTAPQLDDRVYVALQMFASERGEAQTRSSTNAMPCPTPIHMVHSA